eukprot:4333563-Amphidinium_carterae.1
MEQEYLADMHSECDWLIKNFELRKEARAGEDTSDKPSVVGDSMATAPAEPMTVGGGVEMLRWAAWKNSFVGMGALRVGRGFLRNM